MAKIDDEHKILLPILCNFCNFLKMLTIFQPKDNLMADLGIFYGIDVPQIRLHTTKVTLWKCWNKTSYSLISLLSLNEQCQNTEEVAYKQKK